MGYVWRLPHVDAGKVARLEEMLASYEAGLKQGDRLAAIRAGHAFHTIFIDASGNSELLRVTLDRRSLIARFILRSEEHTSELQSLMRISYAVFCLKKQKNQTIYQRQFI